MPSTTSYLLIGLVAAVATFVFTPLVARLARRVGWVVEPDERRVHTVATPDVGGIAMFIGFTAALFVARLNNNFDTIFARNDEPRGVFFAAFLMFMIGLFDDIREISAPAKVAGTIAVAGVLTYYGVTMFYFRVPFVDVFTISDDWILLITVVWLLGMSQAINLIDGLDGLAAGIVAIGALRVLHLQPAVGRPDGAPAVATQHRAAHRHHHRRDLCRVSATQLQPGEDLHGGWRRVAARSVAGGEHERGRRPSRPEPRAATPDRRTSSWRRCSSRCSSSACRSSTRCSRSSAVPPVAKGWPPLTRSTFIIA